MCVCVFVCVCVCVHVYVRILVFIFLAVTMSLFCAKEGQYEEAAVKFTTAMRVLGYNPR